MRTKQKPEDFVVREAYRFDQTKRGEWYVYLMDKQKLSTLQAVEQVAKAVSITTRDISFCGLKDKQGRTEQIVAVRGRRVEMQRPDLRLKFLGRTSKPLSSANLTANRFVVTVRDLSVEEAERVPASVEEVRRTGVVNYFDSQRFGGVKHGQGFLAKDLAKGRVEHALRGFMATPSPLDRTVDARVKGFWRDHWGEWDARVPTHGVRRYAPILKRLRERPGDWVHAFRAIDKRQRALMVFEYQSFLWNEAVRRYLLGRLGADGHLVLRYQAGRQLFPRQVREEARLAELARTRFPLVGPDTVFDDPEIEKAVRDTLAKEHIDLDELALDAVPDMGFKHEPRDLIVHPDRLSVVDPRPDELNRGRLKVTLAFTLPPGAYATLVVRRTLWFSLKDVREPGGPIPPPSPEFIPEETRQGLAHLVERARRSRRRPPRPSHGVTAEPQPPTRRKSPSRTPKGTPKRAPGPEAASEGGGIKRPGGSPRPLSRRKKGPGKGKAGPGKGKTGPGKGKTGPGKGKTGPGKGKARPGKGPKNNPEKK